MWAEIRSKVQLSNESVAHYSSYLNNLFSLLPTTPSESEKLSVLKRYILPSYIQNIALLEISTVDELQNYCKKLETTRDIIARHRGYGSGISRVNLLEPELFAVGDFEKIYDGEYGRSSQVNAVVNHLQFSSTWKVCWQCDSNELFFKQCN
ncbi:hypothetical protein HHI36_008115 [Cryptolaemus montrouzieri]|uniref:Uncharacterized protein n=1 Tax=Cryptolaemus montrouzieri TaxID=559131 RepID=A0ABD2MS30_9CUCU